MRAALALYPVVLLAQAPSIAPPAIRQHGVVNAASRMPPSLPGGAIARGSVFSIFGDRLGPAAGTASDVKIHVGSSAAAIAARPVFVSPKRIDAIMPSGAPLGSVPVTVTWQGETSLPYGVTVVESGFGIFTRNGQGWGPAILPVGGRGPLRPGAIAEIEGTGLGTARAADLEVAIGGRHTRALQAAASARPGHDRIRFRIPKDVPPGCSVPVAVRTAGKSISNTATLAVAARGRDCHANDNWLVREFESGGRRAVILLVRSRIELELGVGAPTELESDDIATLFRDLPDRRESISRLDMLPPAGLCSSFAGATNPGRIESALLHLGATMGGRPLDAGPHLDLRGPAGDRAIGKAPMDWQSYNEQLGGRTLSFRKPTPLFLSPGEYDIAGGGGADVPPFHVSLHLPPAAVWTNRDEIAVVNRARGVTLRWTGAAPRDQTAIIAVNLDQTNGATGVCLCFPKPGAAEFSVPPEALANFPASPALGGIPSNFLALLTISGDARTFRAQGLREGIAGWLFVNAKSVPFE